MLDTMTDAFWVAEPRDVVRVSGPDALTYLHGQVSQDLLGMAVGDSRWTFLLQPAGRVEVLARVRRTDDDTFVFDVDGGYGEALVARLEPVPDPGQGGRRAVPWRVIAVRGVDGVDDLVGPDPVPPEGVRRGHPRRARAGSRRRRVAGDGFGDRPGETIPAETGISDRAVNFTKGCYPGQELVERMDSRGAAAPRRLRVLAVEEGAEPGDPIVHDGAEVGVLTSVAGARALGLVRRNVELGEAPA